MPVKLSINARKILSVVENDADLPLSTVVRRTRLKSHTIRYELAKLQSQGIVKYYPFINVYPLGLTPYSIYFSLSQKGRQVRSSFLKALKTSKRVSWICEVGGRYNLAISVLVHSVRELSKFLGELIDKFGGAIARKEILVQLSLHLFTTKYLFPDQKVTQNILSWTPNEGLYQPDECDRTILAGLVQEDYKSFRELARKLKLPSSTVDRRIQQLKKSGVIAGTAFLPNPLRFGAEQYKLLLYINDNSSTFKATLLEFCRLHQNITVLVENLGAWDYELSVEVLQSTDVVDVVKDLESNFITDIEQIEVVQLFEEHKVICYPL